MRYKVNFEDIKKTHLKWLSTPETSRGQLEDSKTILTLLQEVDVLTAELKASEWVRKDNSLRTYDGLTEKLAALEKELQAMRDAARAVCSHPEFDCANESFGTVLDELQEALIKTHAQAEKKP